MVVAIFLIWFLKRHKSVVRSVGWVSLLKSLSYFWEALDGRNIKNENLVTTHKECKMTWIN